MKAYVMAESNLIFVGGTYGIKPDSMGLDYC